MVSSIATTTDDKSWPPQDNENDDDDDSNGNGKLSRGIARNDKDDELEAMKKDMTELEFVDQTKQDYKDLKGFEDKTQHEPKSLKKAVDAISLYQLKSQTKDDPLNVKRELHFLKDEWVAMKAELAALKKDIKDTEAVSNTKQDLDARKERPYKVTPKHMFLFPPHLH